MAEGRSCCFEGKWSQHSGLNWDSTTYQVLNYDDMLNLIPHVIEPILTQLWSHWWKYYYRMLCKTKLASRGKVQIGNEKLLWNQRFDLTLEYSYSYFSTNTTFTNELERLGREGFNKHLWTIWPEDGNLFHLIKIVR